jgi:hypothetical protein
MTIQINDTDSPALTAADIEACLEQIDAIGQKLAPYVSSLTPNQRRSTLKARKEVDRVVPLLARLGKRFGLSTTQIDTAEMEQQLAVANLALPLLARVTSLRDMLADTVLASHGNAWETASTLYGILSRLARRNPALSAELAVVQSAFRNKKRAAAEEATATPIVANAKSAATPVSTTAS